MNVEDYEEMLRMQCLPILVSGVQRSFQQLSSQSPPTAANSSHVTLKARTSRIRDSDNNNNNISEPLLQSCKIA